MIYSARFYVLFVGALSLVGCKTDDPNALALKVLKTTDRKRLEAFEANMRDVAKYDRERIARLGGDFTESQAKSATSMEILRRYLLIGDGSIGLLYDDINIGFLRATYSSISARELYGRPDVAQTCLKLVFQDLSVIQPKGLQRQTQEMNMLICLQLLYYPPVKANFESNRAACRDLITQIRALTEKQSIQNKFHPAFLPNVRKAMDELSRI